MPDVKYTQLSKDEVRALQGQVVQQAEADALVAELRTAAGVPPDDAQEIRDNADKLVEAHGESVLSDDDREQIKQAFVRDLEAEIARHEIRVAADSKQDSSTVGELVAARTAVADLAVVKEKV